ncbi:MAG TPA: ATP-binding protein [Solirubrobacteraceae bacterium]|nr:ATP-binding protein [Solirubrobacteraceae bacterium]
MRIADTGARARNGLRLPAHASQLGAARDYAWQTAAAFGFDAGACDELAFAVNEAVTNAIRHGAPDEHGQISVTATTNGDRLTLSVRDHGTFLGSPPNRSLLAERGRGFTLMMRLTDAVQLCIGLGSTTVHLSKARA